MRDRPLQVYQTSSKTKAKPEEYNVLQEDIDMNTRPATEIEIPPAAPGVPLLGVLPQVWRNPLIFFLNTAIEHGGVVQIQMGPGQMYLVSHPEAVKRVLLDNNKNYIKGYDKAKSLFGEGLLTSEGEKWLRQRRLMSPAFSRSTLISLLPMMVEAAQQKINEWNARSDPQQPVDMASEMMLLTQTIILKTMFSTDIGENAGQAAEAFTVALEHLNFTMMVPFEFVQNLPIPANIRFNAAIKYLDELIYGFIEERRRNGLQREDLLGMLMAARDEETGEGMTDQQMRDEMITIFLAGHETTASLLGWTWYLLGQNPAIQAGLRLEQQDRLDGRIPNHEDLRTLDYTRKVLEEALRMYPPAWMFARQSVNEDILNGYQIPAGATIMLSPYVTHRLPEFWDDPERFDPERFTADKMEQRHRFAYFPFGGGPRLCIGNNFALMEAPLLLTMLMQNFRFELIPIRNLN
jgi:cytochrome P450